MDQAMAIAEKTGPRPSEQVLDRMSKENEWRNSTQILAARP